MSEMARWSTAMESASSTVLQRGRSDCELELQLYLGLNSDARGSARWSEMWRSCVHELLKNGVAAMARELGEGRRQWRSALRLYSGAVRARERQSEASESE